MSVKAVAKRNACVVELRHEQSEQDGRQQGGKKPGHGDKNLKFEI
jgi:hypothetical protein